VTHRGRTRQRGWGLGLLVTAIAISRHVLVNDVPYLRSSAAETAAPATRAFDALLPSLQNLPSRCPWVTAATSDGLGHDPRITEASGLVASRRHPDLLWTHNDSGDEAQFFALRTDGTLVATYTLAGVRAVDWEDAALGPGPSPNIDYLYFGDLGDNHGRRPFVAVFRLPEPEVELEREGGTGVVSAFETILLAYPDRRHDAETLLVDPESGDLYVVTKERSGASILFRASASELQLPMALLTTVGELPFGNVFLPSPSLVTGGDISVDGQWIVLRTYTHAFAWHRQGATIAETLERYPCPLKLAAELQGEAIAFSPQSDAYFTLAEGHTSTIWRFELLE